MALDLLNSNLLNIQPAPTAGAVTAPSPEVLGAYQTLFGREADMPGALGWTQSGLTGQALLNAMISGAQGADVQAFENYQKSQIQQGYQDLFGREAEETGLNYWLNNTNLIGSDLTNALREGAMGGDIAALYNKADTDIASGARAMDIRDFVNQNQNDPYAIYSAAQKYNLDPETIAAVMGYSPDDSSGLVNKFNLANTISREYGDIGRSLTGDNAIDQEGFNYWFNQLNTGAITPDQFEKAFLTGAMDVVSRGYDADVSSRTIAESLAKGYGGLELIDKANPLDVYEALGREGQTVESLSQLYPNLNPQQINDYLAKVPDAYAQNVDQVITSILGANYASAIDPAAKQNLVNQLLTGDITRDQVTDMFAQSGTNKQQEAQRLAASYMSMFGGTEEDAKALYAKLLGVDYTGAGSVSEDVFKTAKSIFDTSLTDERAGIESLVRTAATREGAENTEFFKNNPDALLIYGDLKTRSDNPYTQYGTINGAPIYDADAVDKYLGMASGDPNLNSASSFAHRSSDRLGVEVGGNLDGGSAFIKRGADVFGLERTAEMTGDSDSGYTPTGRYIISGDLNAAAQQAGINPAVFKDKYRTETSVDEYGYKSEYQVLDKSAAEQIYEAINNKMDGMYLIGSQNPANPNEKSPDNFMYTLYKRTEDGKLIPVNEPTYYEGVVNPDVFKKRGVFGGGFLGDMAQGFASIPGIAELAAFTIPGAAAWYPAIKAAQTAAFTTDLGDIAKTGGMAYLAQQVAPKVAGQLSGSLGIENQILNQAITQGTVGAGMSALAGGSGTEGFTAGAIGGAIGGGIDMVQPEFKNFVIDELGIPKEYAGVLTNTLTSLMPTILTGGNIDPTKVLMNYMLRAALSGNKDTYSPTGTGADNNYIDTGTMDNRDVGTLNTQTSDSGLRSLTVADGQDMGISPEEFEALSPAEQEKYMLQDNKFSKYIKRLMDEGTITYDDGAGLLEKGYRGEDIQSTPNTTLDATRDANWYELLKGYGMTDPDYAPKTGALQQRLGTKYIDI